MYIIPVDTGTRYFYVFIKHGSNGLVYIIIYIYNEKRIDIQPSQPATTCLRAAGVGAVSVWPLCLRHTCIHVRVDICLFSEHHSSSRPAGDLIWRWRNAPLAAPIAWNSPWLCLDALPSTENLSEPFLASCPHGIWHP